MLDAALISVAVHGRMKLLHPDLNPSLDTTAQAAEVTVAYQAVLEVGVYGLLLKRNTLLVSQTGWPLTH